MSDPIISRLDQIIALLENPPRRPMKELVDELTVAAGPVLAPIMGMLPSDPSPDGPPGFTLAPDPEHLARISCAHDERAYATMKPLGNGLFEVSLTCSCGLVLTGIASNPEET